MADKSIKTSSTLKTETSSSNDKENDPKVAPANEKKKDENEEKQEEDIKLDIGEHYLVKRSDDTWRKYTKNLHFVSFLS